MTWKEIAKRAFKKAGFSDTEIEAGLSDLETDVEDTVANKRLSAIFTADEAKGNDSIFKDVKNAAKAEALNSIDAEFKIVEDSLTTEQKAAYAAFGNNTYEKTKYLTALLKEAITKPSGDPNFDDLKKSYETLKGQVSTDYVPKADFEAANSKYSNARKELVHGKIINVAANVVKDETKRSGRHFAKNFIEDAEALLSSGIGKGDTKVKGFIDYDSGKIMRADSPDQPLLINGSVVGIDELVPMVAEFGEWNKGYTPPPADPIVIRTEGGGKEGKLSIASQRTLSTIGD